MSRYVQHQSGMGEKWEVDADAGIAWRINAKGCDTMYYYLPKSEYLEVPAPDRWVDVTADCEPIPSEDDIAHHGHVILSKLGYRLRKVPICTGNGAGHEATKQWAFIVERREP